MTVEEYLAIQKGRVDSYLDSYLLPEAAKPTIIHRAIRYSVFSGGKRFRASLCIATNEAFGGDEESIIPVASGIELIHTYSLIHDDLPCMDNDDLRRGKPTSHKIFGDNIAVLAGDALNALAFELVARSGDCRLITLLARAIGTEGMIGGQVADVESNGQSDIALDDVEYIHTLKTARLITASLEMGAVHADAVPEDLAVVRKYGVGIGLAFQIVDDILDIESSKEVLGKNIGSDEENDKATYPRAVGLSRSKKIAREIIEESVECLSVLTVDTGILRALAEFVISRVY